MTNNMFPSHTENTAKNGFHNATLAEPKLYTQSVAIATCGGIGVLILLVVAIVIVWRYVREKGKGQEYENILKNEKTRRWPARLVILHSKHNDNTDSIPFSVPCSTASLLRAVETSGRDDVSMTSSSDGSLLQQSPRSIGSRRMSEQATSSIKLESRPGAGPSRGSLGNIGTIDPTLYLAMDDEEDGYYPDGHIGRLRFMMQYLREAEKLTVTLVDIKNLPSRVLGTTNVCDPFVRICLHPDTRGHLQSKFKKKTCNPKFDESFAFQVSYKGLEERSLKMTVYDIDRLRRHNVIGHVMYPLRGTNFETSDKLFVSRDLEQDIPEISPEQAGEIQFSLCYNDHLERITVGIFDGKNFKKLDDLTSSDSYVKVSLMRHSTVVKTKRTDTVKRDDNPKFNESFVFKLPMDALDKASIVITAWQSISGRRDRSLGRVVLGSFMFARGKELEHWNEMLASMRDQIIHWHVLM